MDQERGRVTVEMLRPMASSRLLSLPDVTFLRSEPSEILSGSKLSIASADKTM